MRADFGVAVDVKPDEWPTPGLVAVSKKGRSNGTSPMTAGSEYWSRPGIFRLPSWGAPE
jgi:hypothetical protein